MIYKHLPEPYSQYVITTTGNIYNDKWQRIQPRLNRDGYAIVTLSNSFDHQRRLCFVHRLVAMTYLESPPKPKDYRVNHKDENKLNNDVRNLEWCTEAYNNNYGTRVMRICAAVARPVYCLKDGVVIESFRSISEASRATGIPKNSIIKAIEKERKIRGLDWRDIPVGGVNLCDIMP